jgi:hypothetical protein
MKKISWFSLNHMDASGDTWYSQGYYNAALSTIKALQEKECAVFYTREDIPYHINFCPPTYYQMKSKYNIGYTIVSRLKGNIVNKTHHKSSSKCIDLNFDDL